jgi:hypothetical protein
MSEMKEETFGTDPDRRRPRRAFDFERGSKTSVPAASDPRHRFPRVSEEDAGIQSGSAILTAEDGEYLLISASGSYDDTAGIYVRQLALDSYTAQSARSYRGIVFDFADLEYSWGDSILAHLTEIAARTQLPVFVLAGEYSASGLHSLFDAFRVQQVGDSTGLSIKLIDSLEELNRET